MNNSMDDFLPYKMVNIDHPSLLPNLKEINEVAETKAECLEMLRSELKSLQDIEPCLEENFLLRFLRVSKFNTSKALQRILKYYQQQEILLDSLKKISLPLHKAGSVNHLWCSPYRLKNNTIVFIALGGKVDFSKITFAEIMYLDMLAVNGVIENPVNQITGVTLIFDYKGFGVRSFLAHTPNWTRVFVETFLVKKIMNYF
ncbi:hypothetical protein AVEN_244895-1 [Araneus ventricosus]|uniref:CRAL/TRIO N-terminal domain-containing protein n=1 Tax=Araneus ventricosus TaxID=182803 RepID=A0A4Y1ZL87_ARAVE|nr:hypothetical protein AVEN_244895-1 [Araneus ventricosus]